MAYEQVVEGLEWAQNAGADLTGKLHHIAKLASDGDVEVSTSTGDAIIGVIREENVENKPVTIQFAGIAMVKTAGAIVAGSYVVPSADGRGDQGGSATGAIGRALRAAAAENAIIPVMLFMR